MPSKPTREQIAGLNRYLKEPFPEEFDEWGPDDFERFHEIIEGVMKTTFREGLCHAGVTFQEIRRDIPSRKGGIVRENETNPSNILDEVESPEEEEDHHPPRSCDRFPQLLCVVPQCRHWRDLDIEYPDLGRCVLDNAIIRQKTYTVCSDENTRHTARWPVFECEGFEWHDRYAEEDVTWVAVAELPDWPVGPDLGPDTDLKTVERLIGRFTLTRGTPLEDPTDETTEEASEVIPKEKPAPNVIEFPADLSRR